MKLFDEDLNNDDLSLDSDLDNSDNDFDGEPSDEDNSDSNNGDAEPNNGDDNQQKQDKPKFDTLEKALEGYKNLESKLGEQSGELGELREKAKRLEELEKQQLDFVKSKGFDTVEAYNNAQAQEQATRNLASIEVQLYKQHLQECDYPDEVAKLLDQYEQNPTEDLKEVIDGEFTVATHKAVAKQLSLYEGQVNAKQEEAYRQQLEAQATTFLQNEIARYPEEFNNPSFVNLYGEAFKLAGTDLETDLFINLVSAYRDSVIKETLAKHNIKIANDTARSEMGGTNPNSTANISNQDSGKNVLDMSESEIREVLRKYKN